jgi:hypothetical protein
MKMLPCRALPRRALQIIREYSRPYTRPDWRKSKPIITTYKLYLVFRRREMKSGPIRKIILHLLENIENTEWYYTYKTIRNYGLNRYYIKYALDNGIDSPNVFELDGIKTANNIYNYCSKYGVWYNDWI